MAITHRGPITTHTTAANYAPASFAEALAGYDRHLDADNTDSVPATRAARAARATEPICSEQGDYDPDMWFPVTSKDDGVARRLCQSCPVQLACLRWALNSKERYGIWGSINFETETERLAQIKRDVRVGMPARAGSPAGPKSFLDVPLSRLAQVARVDGTEHPVNLSAKARARARAIAAAEIAERLPESDGAAATDAWGDRDAQGDDNVEPEQICQQDIDRAAARMGLGPVA